MIGLVSCAAKKLGHAVPARELYVSQFFRLSLTYALQHCTAVYIASAKHGLLELDQVVEPYDVTLADLTPTQRELWGDAVARGLLDRHRADFATQFLYVLAGTQYVRPLMRGLTAGGVGIVEPLKRMQIGQRIGFLTAQTKRAA